MKFINPNVNFKLLMFHQCGYLIQQDFRFLDPIFFCFSIFNFGPKLGPVVSFGMLIWKMASFCVYDNINMGINNRVTLAEEVVEPFVCNIMESLSNIIINRGHSL